MDSQIDWRGLIMEFSRTFYFCKGILDAIFKVSGYIYNFMSHTFVIPGQGEYTVFELVLGGGLIAIITWAFVKFVLPT